MASYTPGPWTVATHDDREGRRVVEHAGVAVALICASASSPASGGHYFEKDANARLIAAAPDLLDALKACVQVMVEHNAQHVEWDEAVAAIAKAEGR
jgi:hypothetical protein